MTCPVGQVILILNAVLKAVLKGGFYYENAI
jgi:hypothetical protein